MASNERIVSWSGSLVSTVPVAAGCGFIADSAPPVKVWRYWLPSVDGEGWALAMLDENGLFACMSDFGDYAYGQWTFGDREFRAFFAEIKPGYLVRKLAGGRAEYDGSTTLAAIKQHICRARRVSDMRRNQAREEWELLALYDDLATEADFTRWHDATSIECAEYFYHSRPPSDIVNFCRRVLPRLQAVLREQLATEKAVQ